MRRRSDIRSRWGLLACLVLFAASHIGCKALGLGGLTRKTSALNKATNTAKRAERKARETRRVARAARTNGADDADAAGSAGGGTTTDTAGTPPPRNDSASRNVRARLKYELKRLERRCPLDKGGLSKSGLRQCRYAHRNARSALSRIRPAYHGEPLYAKVDQYIKQLNTKIPAWKQQSKNRRANERISKRVSKKFDRLFSHNHWLLNTLWRVKNKKKTNTMSAKALTLYLKRVKRIKGFVEWCNTGEYKSILPSYRYKNDKEPTAACGAAKEWKPLFTQYVNSVVNRLAKEKASWQETFMKRLQEKHKLTNRALKQLAKPREFIASQEKAFSKVYEFLGTSMPKGSFQKMITIAKGFRGALRRSARVNRFPRSKARYTNGTSRRAFANAGRREGFSLVRYGMLFSYWTVKKNRFGLPLRRYRTGVAMYRKRGERHCRIYRMTATSQYKGGGRYAKAFAPGKDLLTYPFIVSRCR